MIPNTDRLQDVVVSTRIRLARNFAEFPFPPKQDAICADAVANRAAEALRDTPIGDHYEFFRLAKIPPLQRSRWVEQHVISPLLLERVENAALLRSDDDHVAIMVNEEDHLRIQAMLPGFQLEAASVLAMRVDDVIERSADYAFHERWGYLTACPSNAGTGMRASAMMHLPALTLSGQMNKLINNLGKIGLTARGMYGEGSEAQANLFQISNQVTLGCSEDDIILALSSAVNQIVERERVAREALYEAQGVDMEDHVWRSLGVLQNARKIDGREFMQLISTLRLGIAVGMVEGISFDDVDKLLIDVQPAGLIASMSALHGGKRSASGSVLAGGPLATGDRDVMRATYVREQLKHARVVEDGGFSASREDGASEDGAQGDDGEGGDADDPRERRAHGDQHADTASLEGAHIDALQALAQRDPDALEHLIAFENAIAEPHADRDAIEARIRAYLDDHTNLDADAHALFERLLGTGDDAAID